MSKQPSIACVIPARLGSKRFPRKILAPLQDKPLIQWVWEAAVRTDCFDRVVIAVDAEETAEVATKFGAEVFLTSPDCVSGTDRLIELQARGDLQANIWVNWQGDEPFITRNMVDTLLQSCDNSEEEVWTLKKQIYKFSEIDSPHVVKVVCDAKGRALYFSRSSIPYYRESAAEEIYYKHFGIYAYSDQALRKIAVFPLAPIEDAEKLEQLRYLYHDMVIRVHETEEEVFGIDTEEQFELAHQMIRSRMESAAIL